MRNRRGFTLTELLITLGAGTTLMMLSVGLIHRSMRWTSAARVQAADHRTLGQLSSQFRADVHRAESAVVEAPDRLRILIRGEGEIRYIASAEGCQRLVLREADVAGEPNAEPDAESDGADVANGPETTDETDAAAAAVDLDRAKWSKRDDYRLGPTGAIRFATLDAPNRVVLEGYRGEPFAIHPAAPQAVPDPIENSEWDVDRPWPAVRLPTVRLEAVVGRLTEELNAQPEGDAS